MILVLLRHSTDAVERLAEAFPSENIHVVLVGPPSGSDGVPASEKAQQQRVRNPQRLADRIRRITRGALSRPPWSRFSPLVGVLDDASAEAHAMETKPLDPATGPDALARVLSVLEGEDDAVVVCADKPGERLGWRLAQESPDVLVVSGVEPAIAIIRALDFGELQRTPNSINTALGGATPPVGTYPFPPLRRTGRPRVVSLVSNRVDGDSRVQKVASSLADLGFESILIGRHPDDERDHFLLGGALVVRIPARLRSNSYERSAPPRTPLTALAYSSHEQVVAARRRERVRARRRSADGPSPAEARVDHLRRWTTGLRISLYTKNRRRFQSLRGDPTIETAGPWRRPFLGDLDRWALGDDLELGFGPYLESLRPDVIHAHDADMLWVATVAARRLRSSGHRVSVVYDAHEYTPGTARAHARQTKVLTSVERKCVPQCDAVVTVSEEIASLLRMEHNLTSTPRVVPNAPREHGSGAVLGLRQRLGLPDSVPLMVYVGGIAPQRGVDLAVSALPALPGVHLAVVAPPRRGSDSLRGLAADLDVADRYHRLDYVAADDVVDFIKSCDMGLIPFRPLPNSELGIPTKYREYVVAGLPIVASDQGLVAEEIRRDGVGELFTPGDTDDLARAVRVVLGDHRVYERALDPQLRHRSTWERQAHVLQQVYEEIGFAADPFTHRQRSRGPRVLIGRANSAGQGTAWASALRRSGVGATSLQVLPPSNDFEFAADVVARQDDWSRPSYRLRAFVELVSEHSHVLVESGAPVFEGTEPLQDLDSLIRSGMSVALVFHGSDVRRPARHAERERWSPFGDVRNAPLTERLSERTKKLHQALAAYEGPIFVSTPDLLDDVPYATWLPVVVDTEAFKPDGRDVGTRDRPLVVHAPSRGPLKGTEHVEPVLRELQAEGTIRYLSLRRIPHALMPSMIQLADIVVDQVLLDAVGVAAAEAMACGRVVVAHLSESAASRYPTRPPIVDATPESLEAVIRGLAADRDRRSALGRRGRDFAVAVHDGRLASRVLVNGLGLSAGISP